MNQHSLSHSSRRSTEMQIPQDLLKQVEAFLSRSALSLAPHNRILDICSEFGEVFDSLSGNGDLTEEIGDLLYSSLALCSELNVENVVAPSIKGIGPADLAKSLGRLAKEELKTTNYGKDEPSVISDGLRASATNFATKVIQFAMDKCLDPTAALAAVLLKYESRIKRTDSVGSGS